MKYLKTERRSPICKGRHHSRPTKAGDIPKILAEFIDEKKLGSKPIEQIPTDVGKEFAYWMLSREKRYYKDKSWSHEYINAAIVEVKGMYHKYAEENRYITQMNIPKFERLRVQPDKSLKRDLLTEEEWLTLTTYRNECILKPDGRTVWRYANVRYSENIFDRINMVQDKWLTMMG